MHEHPHRKEPVITLLALVFGQDLMMQLTELLTASLSKVSMQDFKSVLSQREKKVFTIKLNTSRVNFRTSRHKPQKGHVFFKSCFLSLSNRLKHIEQEVSCGISGQATFWYICISVQRREREREGESARGR